MDEFLIKVRGLLMMVDMRLVDQQEFFDAVVCAAVQCDYAQVDMLVGKTLMQMQMEAVATK